ncbi:hypothetical protein [Amycolatopsis coloradensis]|uniref:hypothetical protein n=1 Tax=Amycolatopsis coloradensis TaxID=76021 RepID=UPI001177B82A|nr:hypothetical protein [Amycolatopsis coloradensis]
MLALPDLDRDAAPGTGTPLARLVDRVRTFVRPIDGLSPVPDAALHLTIQPVNHLLFDAPPVGDDTVEILVKELMGLCGAWSAFSLMMGSPVIGRGGITLDSHPPEPFNLFVHEVREAIRHVCGPDSIGYDTRPGHMALVCATRDLDTDDFASALRHVQPSHADMLVRTIVLARVRQNPPAACYELDVVDRFELQDPRHLRST